MLGQIASFMDSLHLSYDEVVYKIPYRNLIIMQKISCTLYTMGRYLRKYLIRISLVKI